MSGQFYLDDTGLSPLSEIHAQVAGGLSQLTGAGAPQAAEVAQSFGNIAFSVNNALDGVLQSRTGTIGATKSSSETIADLLKQAQALYVKGDMASADKLKAAAETMASQGGGAQGGGAPSGAAAGGAGTARAAAAAPGPAGGGDMAGQMVSQIGQQVGQAASSVGQAVTGLAQGLSQLPQQVMQGVQGIVQSATGAAGGVAGGVGGAAAGGAGQSGDKPPTGIVPEKFDEDDRQGREDREEDGAAPGKPPTGAVPNATTTGEGAGPGRPPVGAVPDQKAEPAQTRPQ
jgi:hypothetical protein